MEVRGTAWTIRRRTRSRRSLRSSRRGNPGFWKRGRTEFADTRIGDVTPVAVYSYAPSAGSARSMNGNAGKPPRGNSFKSGSVPHARSGSSFGNRAGGAKPAVKFTGRRFGRRGMNISRKFLTFCSEREATDG